MRFWYVWNFPEMNAHASLCICADSSKPSLQAYTKYGYRQRLTPTCTPLALLDMSEWASYVLPGLKLRVRNEKLIFLFLNQNICCECSKELSQRDDSFEHPNIC